MNIVFGVRWYQRFAAASGVCCGPQFGRILGHQGCSHAPALAIGWQIGLVEETGKQYKITEIHGNRQINVGLWNVTGLWSVGLEETMGPHIDGTANYHLGQLQWCYDHGNETWWIETGRLQGIVRIHDRVHAVIHDNKPAGRWGIFGVGEPRIDEHRDVMIPVQEDQRLFTQHNEDGIAQFG